MTKHGPRAALALVAALAGALLLTLVSCRGNLADRPPFHWNQNMDHQDKYEPQEANEHYRDRRAMRPEVPGTVAVGSLRDDDHYFLGQGLRGKDVHRLPVELDRPLLERGRRRYDVFCTPCHGAAGYGDGIVVKRGMLPPPSYLDKRIKIMPVGQLYRTITNGVRNMASYSAQIPVRDRWAIVAYVRALQVSGSASLDDVPHDIAAAKGWSK